MRVPSHNAAILAPAAFAGAAFATAILVAALASSCATVQRDVLATSASETDFSRLAALADEDAILRAAPDAARLAAARSEAASLRTAGPLNEGYRARLAAISGELAVLAGERSAASSFLAAAQAAQADDEWVFYLRSRLARDPAAAEAALLAGIAKSATNSLLKAELGLLRLRAGRYREAVSALDEAMDRLSEAQRGLYGPARDKALSLKDAEDAPRGAADYAREDPVSLIGMVVIVQDGTDLLGYLTGAKASAAGPLFDHLAGAGLLGPTPVSRDEPATRAREAFLLWNLVAAREEDRSLLRAYTDRFASRQDTPPVADVPYGSWFFDAALGCVEREILSLPDGRLFLPDQTVSGAQALAAARKAAE